MLTVDRWDRDHLTTSCTTSNSIVKTVDIVGNNVNVFVCAQRKMCNHYVLATVESYFIAPELHTVTH